MPVQMRMSPHDDRFYSPDRDLAYCTPHLVHRALAGFDPDRQEPWVKDYLLRNNVTLDQLGEAAKVIAEYMNKAVLDPKYKQPFDALQASGFFDLAPELQCIVCAKLGQVFISAFFPSMRDVTRKPTDAALETSQLADAAAEVWKKALIVKTRPAWKRALLWLWSHIA